MHKKNQIHAVIYTKVEKVLNNNKKKFASPIDSFMELKCIFIYTL